jgi:hypothetical protein
MQTLIARHLFRLLRRQIILAACLACCGQAMAQGFGFIGNYEKRSYYFGITLAYNNTFFKLQHTPQFLQDDSILVAEPMNSSGFNLGLLGNFTLNDRFDLRLNPNLVFAEKNLHYVFKPDSAYADKKVESILLSIPLQVKFKSDRIGNFRMYLLAGVKYDYDLAANVHSRKEDDLIQLDPSDLGYEAGFGFEFYLPYFIFSPEIKISNGSRDIHLRRPGNAYSDVIGQLLSRMVVISIHLEG